MQLLLAKRLGQEQRINKNKAIPNHGDRLTLLCSNGICNGAPNGGKDGTSTDAHDQQTGALLCVLAEILDGKREDGGVHAAFEEEDCDEDDDGGDALQTDGKAAEEGGHECVDNEDMTWFEELHQARGNEAAEGEDCEGRGKEVRAQGVGDVCIDFGDVVEEKGRERDLGCNVHELRQEPEDGVPLFVEGSGSDFRVAGSNGLLHHEIVGDFRDMDKREANCDETHCDGNTKVHELDRSEIVLIAVGEESMGRDERADKGPNTIERLRKIESKGSRFLFPPENVGIRHTCRQTESF